MSSLREQLSPMSAANIKVRMMSYPHWTPEETCLYLDVSRQRLNELVCEKKLRRIKGVSREGMFARDQVLSFLEQSA